MTDTTGGTVRSIRMERELDAPRELVYRAWTDPAQFAVWFGGHQGRLEDVTMDVRPGGAWRARAWCSRAATRCAGPASSSSTSSTRRLPHRPPHDRR